MSFFSDEYHESRTKFRDAVSNSAAELVILRHPTECGPDGEPLSIDIGVFGAASAPKALFNVNGTHGNESYSGGAAQLQLIANGQLDNLPRDVSVILVHDLNPYGWANDSQLNENLVNLNRNFMDFDDLPVSDELHLDLERAFTYEELSFGALDRALREFNAVTDRYGAERFNSAFMTGQYIAPASINYGGTAPEWSNRRLREFAESRLAGTEKIAYLDWHTGLGDYGQPYELPFWEHGTESWHHTVLWWGEAAVERGSKGLMSAGEKQGDAPASELQGLALCAIRDAAPNAVIGGGIVEFGITSFSTMIQGCVLDLWLMFHELQDHPEYRFWKSLSREFLAPKDPYWQSSVLRHADQFYSRMIAGLIDW